MALWAAARDGNSTNNARNPNRMRDRSWTIVTPHFRKTLETPEGLQIGGT
jgi:hypothetical protein